jgi:hypothetical protein
MVRATHLELASGVPGKSFQLNLRNYILAIAIGIEFMI